MIKRNRKIDRHIPKRKVINVKFFQDERLSYKARGILGHLVSKPKNWKAQVFEIVNNSEKDGITSVKSAMKELVSLGYARLKCYPRKDGQFQGWYYEFFETPQDWEDIEIGHEAEKPQIEANWKDDSYCSPWLDELRNNI